MEPEPYWWKASALTSGPTLLPSLKLIEDSEMQSFGNRLIKPLGCHGNTIA